MTMRFWCFTADCQRAVEFLAYCFGWSSHSLDHKGVRRRSLARGNIGTSQGYSESEDDE